MFLVALAVAASLIPALAGCDPFTPFSIADYLGYWEFPNVGFYGASIGVTQLSAMRTKSDTNLRLRPCQA
jgi:hypothetical protein